MEHVSSIVFSLFRGTPRHADWLVHCLQGAWPQLVGAPIAGVCVPSTWDDRRLVVLIRDPSWRAPLEEMKGELLDRIRGAVGEEVREIELRTDPGGVPERC